MKVFIFFIVNILLVSCQDSVVPVAAPAAAPQAVPVRQVPLDEATWCFIGTVATLPPKPVKCLKPNEIFACAYGEARCDGFGYCGTPPCTWRCWCKNGYKRDTNGNCVKFCSIIAIPDVPIVKVH
jgi:hypothetical protein